jgi:TonB family protein
MEPRYLRIAASRRRGYAVTARFTVDETGSTTNIEVTGSNRPEPFAEPAVEAVKTMEVPAPMLWKGFVRTEDVETEPSFKVGQ